MTSRWILNGWELKEPMKILTNSGLGFLILLLVNNITWCSGLTRSQVDSSSSFALELERRVCRHYTLRVVGAQQGLFPADGYPGHWHSVDI